jgi:glycine dehydrogenase
MNFVNRHIGPSEEDRKAMLGAIKAGSLDTLIDQTIPKRILGRPKLDLPQALSEAEFLERARDIAGKNKIAKSFIGCGYYDTLTPTVILRNILENPGWYTAYTPYQAEISQGRMEALLNFQTMVMDLTAMTIANASLLDEATAVAEGMTLCHSASKKKGANTIFVDENIFPQSLEVLLTRAEPLGITVVVGKAQDFKADDRTFAIILQYPGANGAVTDIEPVIKHAQEAQVLSIVSTDLLALTILKPPGEMGADVVVGSAQRFGVPMGFGGPHAAFLATRDEYKRLIPGRIIGVSKDCEDRPALRLALQTREQHIRRDKATSNICTAQVLLAVMASMYAVYHGPDGLKKIASRVHKLASRFASGLKSLGLTLVSENFFDTIQVKVAAATADAIQAQAEEKGFNLGRVGREILNISWDEAKSETDAEDLLQVFASIMGGKVKTQDDERLPSKLKRTSEFLKGAVFNTHHSETEMLRYLHRLEQKDLALNQSMIPLGSCTMKLNATSEMIPVTWPEFGRMHPFAPLEQAQGYLEMIAQLEQWLCEITGFAAFSLQPNAGSQGEYTGLLVIREYLKSLGQSRRNVCLIPSSAHGTNPASAAMAGFKVAVVSCDDKGNVDLKDLAAKAEEHKDDLAALMVTYPSTHGVFEEGISEICDIVHKHGGQVYMDGANMNAMVGLCQPGKFGADVSHLNLHKTFCIPHGGGGPGVGPIGVAEHLKPFLPKHGLVAASGPKTGISAVSAAPWGSASILPISWAYLAMMGGPGLKLATETAILNANYITAKLAPHYPLVYANANGRVAHECILDMRPLKATSGITVDDIAKRLMDYGFHAPTMSFPVPGTLMIEPTESEPKEELDRFIEAMIQIRQEIAEIERGQADREDNVLKNAPHPVERLLKDDWKHSYSREKAAYPLPWIRHRKFWPSVGRIDNAYGDKNLVCSCLPLEAYQ